MMMRMRRMSLVFVVLCLCLASWRGATHGFSGIRIPGGDRPTLIRIEGRLRAEQPEKGLALSIGMPGVEGIRWIAVDDLKVISKPITSMDLVDQLTPNWPNLFLGGQSRQYWAQISDPQLVGRKIRLEGYVADPQGQFWVTKFEVLPDQTPKS